MDQPAKKAVLSTLGGIVLSVLIGWLFGGPPIAVLCAVVSIIVGSFKLPETIRVFREMSRSRSVKYDDAEFHDPDGNLEEELAAAHIALFLRWCVERDLISKFRQEESRAKLAKARAGAITYTNLLLSHQDGKLLDADLSEEGNRFAAAYYDDYLREYSTACDFPSYSRQEAEHDYAAIAALLDRRFAEFQAGTLKPLKKKSRWWSKA